MSRPENPWSDVFPDCFLPDIFELVVGAWKKFGPCGDWHEEKINRRLADAMQEMKRRSTRFLPFVVFAEQCEGPEDNLKRNRFDLYLSEYDERNYFVFECKKLQTPQNANISKYISEGMKRFVDGRYAGAAKQSGMIAYVIDGNCGKAFTSIDKRITENAAALSCHPPGLHNSEIFEWCFESHHDLSHKKLTLFHFFLADPSREALHQLDRPRPREKRPKGFCC